MADANEEFRQDIAYADKIREQLAADEEEPLADEDFDDNFDIDFDEDLDDEDYFEGFDEEPIGY